MHFFLLIISLGLGPSRWANAQIDPSSALLLNNGRTQSTTVIDSGRYTIRPKKEEAKTAPLKKIKETNDEILEPVTVTVPNGAEPPQPVQTPAPSQQIQVTVEPPQCAPSPAALDSGRRLNIMDISFAPGYLYNNSDSIYSYRSYNTASPVLTADANVWLNPGFSLHGSYTGTLSGSVSDSFVGSKNVPAMQEWFYVGFRARRFFGDDTVAPVMIFGVDYFDYQFRVPSDAQIRQKLHTSGARISLEGEMPVNSARVWSAGISLSPKLRHTEGATGVDFQSGGNVDANGVGFSIGGRLQFERHDSFFWKLTHVIEKDLFSGDASKPDPLNSQTPSGVAVTNSFTFFELGYTWGH